MNKIRSIALSFFVLVALFSCEKTSEDTLSPNINKILAQGKKIEKESIPGGFIKVEGENLDGLLKIILDNNIDILFNPNYKSDKIFFFNIPTTENGVKYGIQPIKFIFKNGEIESTIKIVPGEEFVLITDFDGKGKRNLIEKSYSYSLDGFEKAKSDENSIDKNYAEMYWAGNPGFNGFSIGDTNSYPKGTEPYLKGLSLKAENVFVEFDYNANDVGVAISVRLNPNLGPENWAYNFKTTKSGWQKASINLLQFNENYGFTPPSKLINVETLTDMQFVLDKDATKNPSRLKIDNINFKYLIK
jgi:hypothetical protein